MQCWIVLRKIPQAKETPFCNSYNFAILKFETCDNDEMQSLAHFIILTQTITYAHIHGEINKYMQVDSYNHALVFLLFYFC